MLATPLGSYPTGDVTTGRDASIVAQKGKDDKALACYKAASLAGPTSGEAAFI